MLLWRGRAFWLLLGLAISLAGAVVAVGLSGAAGAVFVGGVSGGAMLIAPMLLRAFGPARVVLRYLERLTTHDALFRALADLRIWFFRGLATRMPGGLGMHRAGDALTRLVGDVEAQDVVYMRILLPLAAAAVLLPLIVCLIAGVDLGLSLLVGALFAASAFVLPWLGARSTLAGGVVLARAMSELRVAVLDSVIGLREIRAFNAEERMRMRTLARETALIEAQGRASRQVAMTGAAAFVCAQAAILAVLLLGRPHGAIAIALMFVTLAGFEAISLLPRAGAQAGHAAAAAARVLEAANGPVMLTDPVSPVALPAGSGLRFDAVRFRWQADRDDVFDGLTLDIPAGSRVALLGPSGIGKSTLAALALRLAAPQSGQILLGGVNIATLAATELRSRIGWLSQATHLFDDTIRANLLLARPNAADATLWEALERARIADTVRALPEGLDTYLGEGAKRFSAGQARRLALARALLSPARILILDEPCSGLDNDTEREFFSTLNDAVDQRSVILIAHRLSGVERLDRIYRLSDGRAVAAAG